jgi:hypothetical protein
MNSIDNAISQINIARPENSVIGVKTNAREQMRLLDDKRFHKKKYRLALQMYAKLDIVEYAQSYPTWAAKDVLSEIVKDYDKNLPAEILLEMSHYIVTEWEKIQASKKELVH